MLDLEALEKPVSFGSHDLASPASPLPAGSARNERKPMSRPHPPVTLPNTQVRLLNSAIVGDTYRLHIALPDNYVKSGQAYPVVYLADGNTLFPLVRAIAAVLGADWSIPRLILVGIGYDYDEPRDFLRYRERDLLPTDASAADASRRQEFTRRGIRRGQAGSFLRFIREELKPFVDANYRTNPDDSTYAGDSYGGLFGLYALFHHPDTFNRYVIGSPAVHHDNCVTLAYERDYAARHDDLPCRVFLSVGAREEGDDPLIDASFQFVTNVNTLADTLRARRYPGLQLTPRVFADETHASVIPRTISRGLRVVFG
jgi:predicted alpha/beta superfamily hydrolase